MNIHLVKEYYGQRKLKLSCLVIIIEIMCGGEMTKTTHQRKLYQLSNLAVII